jgi:hypothetical protein
VPVVGTGIGAAVGTAAGSVKSIVDWYWGDNQGRPKRDDSKNHEREDGRHKDRKWWPFGDGYGDSRREPVKMPGSSFTGIAGAMLPETGDGEGGGRGPQTYKWLEKLMAGAPPHRITSKVRPNARTTSGNTSYHATGHALDIGGPTPGRDTNELLAINRWLSNKLGAAAQELIYSGPGGINLHGGKPHTYKGKVRDLHHDHVHVAVTQESLKRIGQKVEGIEEGGELGAATSQARRAAKHKRGIRGFRGFAQRNGFSERRLIERFFQGVGTGLGAEAPDPGDDPSEGSSEGARNGASGADTASGSTDRGSGRSAMDKFLFGLRMHESGGDYAAENGGTRGARGGNDTSASGAYQYIDGTWARYKGYAYAAAAPAAVQDERARIDVGRYYDKYKDWRMVAAAHFRGEGWLKKNMDPSKWGGKGPGNNPSVNAYVKDVLQQGGLPETGDGYGAGPATAAQPGTPEANVVEVRRPQVAPQSRGGERVVVQAPRGGGVHIAKVEVHLHNVERVSNQEARRIGKMIAEQAAQEMKMKELAR